MTETSWLFLAAIAGILLLMGLDYWRSRRPQRSPWLGAKDVLDLRPPPNNLTAVIPPRVRYRDCPCLECPKFSQCKGR